MSVNLEELKDFLNNRDRFCNFNAMRITVLKTGYAEAELEINENVLNSVDVVQGGAVYTLCDLAFAGAVWSHGIQAVGLNSSISYLRPGRSGKIKAVATAIKQGKTIGVCNIDVFDEQGEHLARSTMTCFVLDRPFTKSH